MNFHPPIHLSIHVMRGACVSRLLVAVPTACTTHWHVLRCAFDEIRFKWKAAEESSAEMVPCTEGLAQALDWARVAVEKVTILVTRFSSPEKVVGSSKATPEEGEAEDWAPPTHAQGPAIFVWAWGRAVWKHGVPSKFHPGQIWHTLAIYSSWGQAFDAISLWPKA